MFSIDSIDEYIKKQKLLLAQEKERLKSIDENIKKLTINNNQVKTIKKQIKNDVEVPLHANQNTYHDNNLEYISESDKICDEATRTDHVDIAKESVKNSPKESETDNKTTVPDNILKQTNKSYNKDKIYENPFDCYENLLLKSQQISDNQKPANNTTRINKVDKDVEEYQFKVRNDNLKRKSAIEKENNDHKEIKLKNFIKNSEENANKNEMDQWISDKFYSHFPSLNEGILNKKILSHARQLEYQEYLKKISKNQTKIKNKHIKKAINENINDEITDINNNNNNNLNEVNKLETLHHTPEIINIKDNDKNTNLQQTSNVINDIALNKSIRKGSPRYRLLEDLITPNILNSDIVEERNKQEAVKELNKKMEYQKELIKQIEDKRKEIERLKERERIEEEALTKRLEDQLKTMELEEQLEMENIKSEKIRLSNEQNHLLRMQLLSKLNNDHKLYNPYTERKTQSENGKDNLIDKKLLDDRNIYKFFTNSARYNKNNFRKLSSSSSSEEILESDVSLTDNLPSSTSTTLKKPQAIINKKKEKCHYCTSNDKYCKKCNQYVITTTDKKLNICLICYKHLLLCNKCKKQTDICVNCLKYQRNDNDSNNNNNMKIMCKYCYNYIKVTENARPNQEQPYSLNLGNNSIFNPNNKINEKKYSINIKNGNIIVDQLTDNEIISTNKRIEKLYDNYDDLRKIRNNRKSIVPSYSHNPDKHNDYPIFNEGEILIRKKPFKHAQHAAFKTIEQKWDIPGAQRANIIENNNKPRILTQLGAIRKQLQLEQLEIDENTTYPSNSYRKK